MHIFLCLRTGTCGWSARAADELVRRALHPSRTHHAPMPLFASCARAARRATRAPPYALIHTHTAEHMFTWQIHTWTPEPLDIADGIVALTNLRPDAIAAEERARELMAFLMDDTTRLTSQIIIRMS